MLYDKRFLYNAIKLSNVKEKMSNNAWVSNKYQKSKQI